MDRQKAVSIAHKAEAWAIGFIGIFFFSIGTSYFQEQLLYRMPRILLPVYDLFGNVGLAIGLLVLGGGTIYWGFSKWKAIADKKRLYWILAVVGIAVGVVLANINLRSSEKIMEDMDTNREAQIDKIRYSGGLNFGNPEVDKYFGEFDELYERFEKSLADNDTTAIADCENELYEWSLKMNDFFHKLSDDEKQEVARYNAKLLIQWQDLRTEYSE
ncbi:MAG: hypothetical protein LBU80_03070 [Rikenellaceae bacterium]|jgi:uncharacterized membrane-anchored protein YhcB (DUF1043 family)|nr:hypothetical protein [Rikenellaceae bacterium]